MMKKSDVENPDGSLTPVGLAIATVAATIAIIEKGGSLRDSKELASHYVEHAEGYLEDYIDAVKRPYGRDRADDNAWFNYK